jgi:hypothetical protein
MDYYKQLKKTFLQKYWLARKPNAYAALSLGECFADGTKVH